MGLFKNYVEVIGNLGDNPKYIMSAQNQPRYTFDICTNKPYKEGDEWKSKSTWVKCTAWGNLATALSRMQFAQGDRVMIEGELRNNNWISSQTNEQHNEMYVLVTEMRKMARSKQGGSSKSSDAQANGSNVKGQPARQTAPDYQREAEAQMQQDMEDLPF